MCGIAGFADLAGRRPADPVLARKMCDAIAHRGPDDSDYYLEDGIALGHRRLSIIDLASGRQPIANADGSVVVTYNGEIYNYRELRAELERAGHRFRTQTDTEVLVHGWTEWGEACVERFNGMFAYVLWDRRRQVLFLARDRLGIKPLHYAILGDGTLVFASELKAMMVHPGIERELDVQAVEDFMSLGYVAEPRSIIASVRKLEPGHTLTIERGNYAAARPRQYWDVPFERRNDADDAALHEEVLHQLGLAVERRMIADVPLGAFLSGGVDSSAVVSAMAGLTPDPVLTCSITFAETAFDESRYSEGVAAQYGTNHFSQQVAADDLDLIDGLAAVYDEPFADSSAIPTYRVCEVARRQVKVALSGDGADETFAGYRRYQWHCREERVRNLLPAGLRRPVFGALASVYPKLDWAPSFLRAKTTLNGLSLDPVAAYLESVSRCSSGLRRQLYTDSFARSLQGYTVLDHFRAHAERAPEASGLALIQYLDLKTWLPGDILTKVDRASMAHGLEVRVPFLDHEYVAWALGLPDRLKINGTGKYALKKALESRLDHDLLYRPKMGFSVPLARWLRGPARETARARLAPDRLERLGLFAPDRVGQLLAQHESGRSDHSTTLWSLLMFENSVSRLLGTG